MEGMISKEFVKLQREYFIACGYMMSIERWSSGLITRLLEITHGQWLYRNFVVHDNTSGILATQKKEELTMEIEKQQDLGKNGLLEEDQFLAEVNLEDLATTSGERQEYWLLAIRAARKAKVLKEAEQTNQVVSDTNERRARN